MLQIKNKNIIDNKDKPIFLRGIALGGWLMMEGYMLGGENIPESKFKESLDRDSSKPETEVSVPRTFSHKRASYNFSQRYRASFITQADADKIKGLGFNCVRIPFNFRILEERGFGIDYLKYAAELFASRGIYVMLDMHAVPGSQNKDWHSDSSGEALFFEDETYRKEYVRLWQEISNAFKDAQFIAGYDIMNEPVTDKIDLLVKAYSDVISTIRKNGDNHIIFLEGNRWAQEADILSDLLKNKNTALSIHYYEPSKFTFAEDHSLAYPGDIMGETWDKNRMRQYLEKYNKFDVPVYVGEFGVSSNRNKGELQWLKDAVTFFGEFGWHYTYWTYKSCAPMNFPDGLFQLFDKSLRMEDASEFLKNKPDEYFKMLDTSNYKLNNDILNIIAK